MKNSTLVHRGHLSSPLPRRYLLGLASALVLGGCATGQVPDSQVQVQPEDRGLFAHRYTESLPSTGWNRLEYIRELEEKGQGEKAIALLKPLIRSNSTGEIKLNSQGANGSPEAAYELGRIYEDGRGGIAPNPTKAAHYYRMAVPFAYSGLDNASLHLGRLYRQGNGVKRDPALAWNLFQQAVDHDGNPSARIELAEMQLTGEGVPQDIDGARQQFEQAAAENEPRALRALAENYAPGGAFGSDPAKARRYAERYAGALTPQAEQGDVSAMLGLSRLYAEDGLLPQPARQKQWLTRAADSGDPQALAAAGHLLLDDADPARGIDILTRAAKSGNADAAYWLGQAYLGGDRVQSAPDDAEKWLRDAVQQGNLDAARTLGNAYIEGDVLPRNPAQGIPLLERAAKHDDAYALALLGNLYLDGDQVRRQPQRGIDYLRKAHELGHPYATERLGEAYLNGDGTQADPVQGVALLKQAATQNQSGAARSLGIAYMDGTGLQKDPAKAKQWLARAVDQDPDDTTSKTRLGRGYLEGTLPGRSQDGIDLLRQSANQGDAYAMVVLGRAYRDGVGVEPDLQRSELWLQRAQRAGHPSAQQALARTYRTSGEQGNIDDLIRAAQMGEVPAMADLGRAYLRGDGVRANYSSARKWLSKAADAGHPGATASLGRMYQEGLGVDINKARAANYFERAVAAGHVGAEADLGEMLLHGNGVPANPQRGVQLLTRAANAGHGSAGVTLGEAYLNGTGVAADPEKGVRYLERAANAGDDNAQRVLGLAYLDGNGVKRDGERAVKWLSRAADRGNVSAQAALGSAYLEGQAGIAQDVERGKQLLTAAADTGHAGAEAALGRAYLSGEVLPRDPHKGAELLVKAAKQGHQSARLSLAQAYLQSRGIDFVNQQQAMIWLDGVMESDSGNAIQTLQDLLEDPQVASAASADTSS
ncbi:SEL1-like repeat protein [Salinicola rhizosphaerae]|uniref:Sel1 repeat family protein n=1 Tax=Salinicola rhizosphaerae TaxID=1443141 RepID=A0ABQ3E6M1_9GAMM|nr:tetratricopeptide repeat protein [Salinicola rhizosphaerae]GHB28137.1 hypothetical protein GCM10009038_28670 [Salinicola rhizosphaerae]